MKQASPPYIYSLIFLGNAPKDMSKPSLIAFVTREKGFQAKRKDRIVELWESGKWQRKIA